ncbi:MAG: adenosine deaminase [Patescibacteria group bacterium]|nr:MAG: adenosine deaminase [Patescibacteria group bacterium]
MLKPLFELHLHLDGSLRLDTMLDIARAEGVALPAMHKSGLYHALRCGQVRDSLPQYLEHFAHTTAVMQSQPALKRIAMELMEDLAADGVKYAEVRFMPSLHTARGISEDFVMGAVLDGLGEGGRRYGVRWGLIVCSMRHVDPEVTRRMIDLAIRYKSCGVVAVDLAGDDNLPAFEHAPHFLRARENGLHVTMHAAEEGPPERVMEAVERFGAERIGHGVKAIRDPRVMDFVKRHAIGIEACLTSNIQMRTAASYESHPALRYLCEGVLVSLNTDNRMLAGTTMQREFEIVRERWCLVEEDERQLLWNAIHTSFAPPDVKTELYNALVA